MSIRQMLERRDKLVAQMREMHDAADADADGSLTIEQQATFDKIRAAVIELQGALRRRGLIENAELARFH